MAIEVRIQGIAELRRNFANAGSSFDPVMKRALGKTVSTIQGNAKEKAPVAFGKMKASIRKSVKGLTGEVVVGKKYGIFVEEGTRPHWPPIAPLERWAALKLGDPGLGYVVARKISQRGTKAQPFMEPAVERAEEDIAKFFGEAIGKLVLIMAK